MAEPALQLPELEPEASLDAAPADPKADALREAMRIAEALIFASPEPVEEKEIAKRLPQGVKASEALQVLRQEYAIRGVNLVRVATRWTFRTAQDLSWLLSREKTEQKKLSRAALETLAIIAYHQPTTRAEIEDIRGVAISKGTLDVLLETGWVRPRGRRKAPGRPVTYGTTDGFLMQFGLETLGDLPGLEELKGAGLFDGRLPPGFGVPQPKDDPGLRDDEDPLEEDDTDLFSDLEDEIVVEVAVEEGITVGVLRVPEAANDADEESSSDVSATLAGADVDSQDEAVAEDDRVADEQGVDADEDNEPSVDEPAPEAEGHPAD